jgi:hypothetical protein
MTSIHELIVNLRAKNQHSLEAGIRAYKSNIKGVKFYKKSVLEDKYEKHQRALTRKISQSAIRKEAIDIQYRSEAMKHGNRWDDFRVRRA